MKERVLIWGASGRLGSELVAQAEDRRLVTPRSSEVDIRHLDAVVALTRIIRPNVIINLAAVVGAKECDIDRRRAWDINVLGAQNVAISAREMNARYIYVSTNSVFDGEQGNYKEEDAPNPTYYYATTKVAGEQSAGVVDSNAVVRVDFFPMQEPKYRRVFSDHYTSKISARETARKLWTVVSSDYQGIIHMGQERDSLFNIMSTHFDGLEPITIAESTLPNFPKDLSFDLTRWRETYGDR